MGSHVHELTQSEKLDIAQAHNTLKIVTVNHSPRCQCNLCSAVVLTEAQLHPGGRVENVIFDQETLRREADQRSIGEAMLR